VIVSKHLAESDKGLEGVSAKGANKRPQKAVLENGGEMSNKGVARQAGIRRRKVSPIV
jgi:hypothetical protein